MSFPLPRLFISGISPNKQRSIEKSSEEYNDVWYRRFMKPLSRDRAVPYYESYQRRILRPNGIPVNGIYGLHSLFKPNSRIYSPLFGLIYNYNNFIDNLYKYGDVGEPAVQLVRLLFHVIPGGEVPTAHIESATAAFISSRMIGEFFEVFERLKQNLNTPVERNMESILSEYLLNLIVNHPDYISGIKHNNDVVNKAKNQLVALHEKEAGATEIRKQIKYLEGDHIKLARHKIKRLEAEREKTGSVSPTTEIEELQRIIDETSKEVKNLRQFLVTSFDFKVARKDLRRAENAVDVQLKSTVSFAASLANSFCAYDIAPSISKKLPPFTTTAILLAFMWRKYNSIQALNDYFAIMYRMEALNVPMETVTSIINQNDSLCITQQLIEPPQLSSSISEKSKHNALIHQMHKLRLCEGSRHWDPSTIESAVVASITKPGLGNRPPIVPFSYVSWAAYSEFPDCGETALRNLINQMIYNPATTKFDVELLCELQSKYYPEMNPALIAFYSRNKIPQDSTHNEVAKEWIVAVSGLNQGRDDGLKIHYRRAKQQQNIASPYINVLRVFNALMGIEPIDRNSLPEIALHINELRKQFSLSVDTSGVAADGFGVVSLTSSKVSYELQSYRPVHFSFVQAETVKMEATGRDSFRLFKNLMNYTLRTSIRVKTSNVEMFEILSIASLFIPYHLQRHHLDRFFQKYAVPLHWITYFSDLAGEIQQTQTLQLLAVYKEKRALKFIEPRKHKKITQDEVNYLETILQRIRNYKEPTFIPT